MTYIERIFDAETGETIERPFTKEEIAKVEATKKIKADLSIKQEKDAADKAALLTKLGITADEAKLLLS